MLTNYNHQPGVQTYLDILLAPGDGSLVLLGNHLPAVIESGPSRLTCMCPKLPQPMIMRS